MAEQGGGKASTVHAHDSELALWIAELSEREAERLRQGGVERVLPLTATSYATQDTGTVVLNRVDVSTGFDFDRVSQILISPPTECPHKPHFAHVHVVLQAGGQDLSAICLLVPYLYDTRMKRNTLKAFVFKNKSGKETALRVDNFSADGGS